MMNSRWAKAAPASNPPPASVPRPPSSHIPTTTPPADTMLPAEETPKPAPTTDSGPDVGAPQTQELQPVHSESTAALETMATPFDYDTMDPFAQTASTDDLFLDEDFVPVEEPIVEQAPVEITNFSETTAAANQAEQAVPQIEQTTAPRAVNGNRDTQRGRGRGGRGGRYNPHAPRNTVNPQEKESANVADGTPADNAKVTATVASADGTPGNEGATATGHAQTPNAARPFKTPAVRGDRSATGGPARKRLTEEELAARMEAIALRNSEVQAAHERAEADQASFEAREAIAAKRVEEQRKARAERTKMETANRRQMLDEREKNRLRKLATVDRREWEKGKEDNAEFFKPTTGWTSPEPEKSDTFAPTRNAGRGRGGARGGRGGGRGGLGAGKPADGEVVPQQQEPQKVPSAEDFPALPATKPNASWADEVNEE